MPDERLKCIYCHDPIGPSSSFDYDEMGFEGEGIVTIYSCKNEKCSVDDIYIFEPQTKE